MACQKIKYYRRIDAKIALASTQRSQSSTRNERRIYWCHECRALHLTSQK